MRYLVMFLFLFGATAYAADADVIFYAEGKPIMSFEGKGKASCEIKEATAKCQAKWEDFKTGMGLRDSHMLEHLNAKKFPFIVLVVTNYDEKGFEGTLEVRNVTKPIKGSRDGKKLKFETKITDFGMAIPTKMGVTVEDVIKVEVEVK